MIFAPKPLCNLKLKPDELAEDKKHCQKIGPCGIGKKAVYLNSFYIDRCYYVTFTDVRRVFKRVAMSKGGYSGKGLFGSMPYLVVQMANGQEKQCNFKHEEEVDRFLSVIERTHPEIPTHSKAAEERLRKAAREEEARYLKHLSPDAHEAVKELESAKDYLERKPEVSAHLSAAAKRKRSVDGVKRTNLALALTIMLLAIAAIIIGIVMLAQGHSTWPVYFVLFGLAGIFFVAAAGILPTAKRNKKSVQRDWDEAVRNAEAYLGDYDGAFPVPAQYAHGVVLDRMIRVIREGKAESAADAFEIMKEELRALDATKKVSQKEYDEIVAVKPMFIVCDYR